MARISEALLLQASKGVPYVRDNSIRSATEGFTQGWNMARQKKAEDLKMKLQEQQALNDQEKMDILKEQHAWKADDRIAEEAADKRITEAMKQVKDWNAPNAWEDFESIYLPTIETDEEWQEYRELKKEFSTDERAKQKHVLEMKKLNLQIKEAELKAEEAAQSGDLTVENSYSPKAVNDQYGANVGFAIGTNSKGETIVRGKDGSTKKYIDMTTEYEGGLSIAPLSSAEVDKLTAGQFQKLKTGVNEDKRGIDNLMALRDNAGGLRQGLEGAYDRILGDIKTIVGSDKTPEQKKAILSDKLLAMQIPGMKGGMGGGVLSNQDIEWIMKSIGGNFDLLWDKESAIHMINKAIRQKVDRYNEGIADYNMYIKSKGYVHKKEMQPIGYEDVLMSQEQRARLEELRARKAQSQGNVPTEGGQPQQTGGF